MTIDISELRMLMQDFKLAGSPMFVQTAQMGELLDRLEAAEKDVAIKEEVIDSLTAVVKRLDAQCDAAEKERDDFAQQLVQSEIGKREISEAHDALRTALEKIADWNSVGGPYPETNKAWCAMAIVTAREAVPQPGETK